MKEDFLHYAWKFSKFNTKGLVTTHGESIHIFNLGIHNQDRSGPDFFHAQIEINAQHWAGNVEIHLKSSDWYAHGHEKDKAYENVILHVVWEHDMDVFRKDKSTIPTLVLKNYISSTAEKNYRQLMHNQLKWIKCENDFNSFSELKLKSWFERLYVERLEAKSLQIQQMLLKTNNNWDEVLFHLLLKNFGLKINGEAFFSLAQSIPFRVFQKCMQSSFQLEALLLGQAHLLENNMIQIAYYQKLKSEYTYLKQKFNLQKKSVLPVQFYGARPTNFPTIRLAQFANLYAENQHLFSNILECKKIEDIKKVFDIKLSSFWITHYTFEKESKPRGKKLSSNFIDLLIINTLTPMQFSFAKFTNNLELENISLGFLAHLPKENNRIVDTFNALKKGSIENAIESQAALHLKKNYCDKHRCLNCNLGIELLGR